MATQADNYGFSTRFFHWTLAILILTQLTTGILMTRDAVDGSFLKSLQNGLQLYDLHKVTGLVILAFVTLRIVNRLAARIPALDPSLPAWQKGAAHTTHFLLYLLMLAVPITGWLGISMYPALTVYGAVTLPAIAAPDRPMSEQLFEVHEMLAFAMIALIALHLAAVAYHTAILRDGTLARMAGGSSGRS